ncbi:MAG: amino acid ABC transporter permease [Agrobacterium sp.]|nr:amino acid ABC transporter permease [Agrobacterium sp.]
MNILSVWSEWLPELLEGLAVTLKITAVSVGLGIPLGLLLALGVLSKNKLLQWTCLLTVEIGRGAPALVILHFVYYGLPSAGLTLTAFAAASVALAWNTGAYTSEIIRAGLNSVPYGQTEAVTALGFTRFDALRYVIVPQGLRVAIPALLAFSIVMLQASSLCFTIALPELLSRAYELGTTNFKYISVFSLAALLYISICAPAALIVSWLEHRLGSYEAR